MRELKHSEVVSIMKAFPSLHDGTYPHRAIYLGNSLNMMVFEYISDTIYRGHYFLTTLRGREAISLCDECLSYMFNRCSTIIGTTPVHNKAAIWMNRKLGATSIGKVSTPYDGECELFMLTKEDWRTK